MYLPAHGVVEVVLVDMLLMNRERAYPWMRGVLVLFIGQQLFRIPLDPTLGQVLLTVFDAVIAALTIGE